MKCQMFTALLLAGLGGCGQSGPNDGGWHEQKPATAVTLTQVRQGRIERLTTLSAITAYQNKSVVSAPVAAFVSEMAIQPGMRVQAGATLCLLQSREQRALGADSLPIAIKAERDGVVIDVQRQAGSFVAEGTPLCSIAEIGSLVFEVNVPFEMRSLARRGRRCSIWLPDGTRLEAIIGDVLPSVVATSQSLRAVARAKAPFLPEGMTVEAVFSEGDCSAGGMLLPKQAVHSDETLTRHWVMRMADDSTAVSVAVEVVGSNGSEIEIASDAISPRDRIILNGGYGLEDGARVVVENENPSERP